MSEEERADLRTFFTATCSCRGLVLALTEDAAATGDDAAARLYREAFTKCSLALKARGVLQSCSLRNSSQAICSTGASQWFPF